MKLSYPVYYNDFHCLAGACPDSCCALWEVDVDDEAAAFYRNLPGALGDRLRQVLTRDNTMTLENRRCPMWRRDGLCRIQAELGHDALCHTCREFPRLTHDYGDFAEKMLELSCPEAARLIFSCPDQWEIQEQSGGSEPDYDWEVMEILQTSRLAILDFLHTTELPLNRALSVLLVYAHAVQGAIDSSEDYRFDAEECYALAQQFAGVGQLSAVIDFFRDLEILTPQWSSRLTDAHPLPVDDKLRPLAVYMVRRYWLQAVSDYDLVSRAKLTVSACILVAALGGTVEAAQLFSKEIENDPDNIDALLDGAYTSQAFTDANLLGLLK